MSTTADSKRRTDGVKKILSALKKFKPGEDGTILVTVHSQQWMSVQPDTPAFWTFKPQPGCVDMVVTVRFNPASEELVLSSKWRRATDNGELTLGGRTHCIPQWPHREEKSIHIDELAQHGLKALLMRELELV